jgi:glycosyltransferase involved in cell wall biosynthesis
VLCGTDHRFSQGLRDDGIPVDVRPLRLRTIAGDVAWLRRYCREHGIRLVHTTMAHYHQFAWLATRGTGIKAMWFNHGPCPAGRWKGLAHAFPADAVGVMCRFMEARHNEGITLAPKPRMVAYGLEDRWFEPRPDLRAATRAALGLADGELGIGILGRIDAWKRQHCLLDAFAAMPPELVARCRLFVAGEPALGQGGDYFDELKRRQAAHPHRERVRLLGYQDSEAFLEAIDVKVHCSQEEPFGMVVVEAMAKGKVVIAADGGALPEIVADGVDGFLQDPADTPALAARLAEVVRSHDDLAGMRAEARRSSRRRYNAARLVADVERLYDELLGLPAADDALVGAVREGEGQGQEQGQATGVE